MLIWNHSVQDCVLYRGLEFTHNGSGLKSKDTHYFQSVNRWLEVTDTVLLLQVNHLLAYQFEVLQMTFLLLLVLGGYICLTQSHQIFNIIAVDLFSIFILKQGWGISSKMLNQGKLSPMLELPLGAVYMVIPIGLLFMALYFTIFNIQKIKEIGKSREKEDK